MRIRGRTAALAAVLVMQGVLIAPAGAQETDRVTTLADGLNAPRGVHVTDDSTVYVAESGTGADDEGDCFTEGEGEEQVEICIGDTATVTQVAPDGTTDHAVTGLASIAFGQESTGASDVTVAPDGTMYVSVGLGESAETRDAIAEDFPVAAQFGTIQRVEEDGSLTTFADVAAFEAENDPDGQSDLEEGNDSNPNAVLATDDSVYVADAGGNSILRIDRETGEIFVAAVLENRDVPPPTEFGDEEIPMQAVPTSLTTDPDGELVFGQLTGFPFPVGGANVYTLGESETPEVVAEGFTATMGVGYRDGELFAVEFAHNGLLAAFGTGDLTGALVRVRSDGTRIALLRDVLQVPGGMDVGPDGMIYISNGSIFPAGGSLLRFDPSLAADPATQAACPPDEVGGATLPDIADSVHEEAIVCTAWHGLFEGYADGTFKPGTRISRGQYAATIARVIEATGTELPPGQNQFPDVSGTHADAIESLAAAGIVQGFEDGTFGATDEITRAQAARIVVDAYEYVTDSQLATGDDAFDDDDSSVHEAQINAAANAGWIQGTGERQFAPSADITRAQVASVLARLSATLVTDGLLSLPS